MTLQELMEDVVGSPGAKGAFLLDEANHTLKGVLVCGLESTNRRRYTPSALQNAVHLYEDAPVHLDHFSARTARKLKGPTTPARFGRIRNPRFTDQGIRADLEYKPDHPFAPTFVGWVKTDPAAIGLSHNILGDAVYDGSGFATVDRILEVRSVDLVAEPATTGGLFGKETTLKESDFSFTLTPQISEVESLYEPSKRKPNPTREAALKRKFLSIFTSTES